jgi:hypothetical protein
MKRSFHAIDHQSVSGIVTALKTDYTLGAFGQPIDQFALALVAPLGTHYHHVS